MILPKKTRNNKNFRNKTFKRIHKKKIGGSGNNDLVKDIEFTKHYKLPTDFYYDVGNKDSKIGVKKNLSGKKEGSEEIDEYEKKIGAIKNYQVGDYISLIGKKIILKCVGLKKTSVLFIKVKNIPNDANIIEINFSNTNVATTITETVENTADEDGNEDGDEDRNEDGDKDGGNEDEDGKNKVGEGERENKVGDEEGEIEDGKEAAKNNKIAQATTGDEEIEIKELEDHIYYEDIKDLIHQVLIIVGDGLVINKNDFNQNDNIIIISYVAKYDYLIKEKLKEVNGINWYYKKIEDGVTDEEKINIRNFINLRINSFETIYKTQRTKTNGTTTKDNIENLIKKNEELKTKYNDFVEKIDKGSIKNSNNEIINFKIDDLRETIDEINSIIKKNIPGYEIDQKYESGDDILNKFLETIIEIINKYGKLLNYYLKNELYKIENKTKGGAKPKNYSFKIKDSEGKTIDNENNPGIFSASHTKSTITINKKKETTIGDDKEGISFDKYNINDYEVNSCFKIGNIILKCISLEMKDGKPEAKFSIVKECANSIEVTEK